MPIPWAHSLCNREPRDVEAQRPRSTKEFENSSAPTKTENRRAWQLSFVSFLGNLKFPAFY